MIAYMVCYASVIDGDCVILKDAAGRPVKTKALPMNYVNFSLRVMRSKAWSLIYAGPGSFHFMRIAR